MLFAVSLKKWESNMKMICCLMDTNLLISSENGVVLESNVCAFIAEVEQMLHYQMGKGKQWGSLQEGRWGI